ncbi:MAG: (d)CMP kinase [Gemmatimonadales bacterium]|nr:MAG: (d)CMP kinase [Gemmatimonadales bacterium]
MTATPVIAIDGPAASGKSSTAKAVAKTLGFSHLDSGALYRGVTLVASTACGARSAADLDEQAILQALPRLSLALEPKGAGFSVHLEGRPVDQEIRTPDVTALVSAVSALPAVRAWVTGQLREVAKSGRAVVVDGRDIGTEVFPHATLKVFLTASPRTRAERRLIQRGDVVSPEDLDRESALLAARDRADSGRAVSPLRMASDAVPLDGTGLTFDQQVATIVRLARSRLD